MSRGLEGFRVTGVVTMRCPKCDGLMIIQSFFDHFIKFEAWRCVNCGNIIAKKERTIEYDVFSIFSQQLKQKNRK